MGLDQYLLHQNPDYFRPGINHTGIGYWRKDWDLQEFIGSGNCESILVTEDLCNEILDHLNVIYGTDDESKFETFKAFSAAKELIQRGEEVLYEADW